MYAAVAESSRCIEDYRSYKNYLLEAQDELQRKASNDAKEASEKLSAEQ